MANVLNEFLFGVSKGFADAAFASFSRRRSTVREDIAMSFGEAPFGEEGTEAAGSEFVDMIRTGETAASQVTDQPRSGVVDSTSRGRGRPKGSGSRSKSSGRGRSRGSSGLKEI